jgi:hypothetical protein
MFFGQPGHDPAIVRRSSDPRPQSRLLSPDRSGDGDPPISSPPEYTTGRHSARQPRRPGADQPDRRAPPSSTGEARPATERPRLTAIPGQARGVCSQLGGYLHAEPRRALVAWRNTSLSPTLNQCGYGVDSRPGGDEGLRVEGVAVCAVSARTAKGGSEHAQACQRLPSEAAWIGL